jgi:hypothetical protein
VCFHNFDHDQNNTRNVQVKFLLSVFCFPFHSLKPIRPRTLNLEKTWNGLTQISWKTSLCYILYYIHDS